MSRKSTILWFGRHTLLAFTMTSSLLGITDKVAATAPTVLGELFTQDP